MNKVRPQRLLRFHGTKCPAGPAGLPFVPPASLPPSPDGETTVTIRHPPAPAASSRGTWKAPPSCPGQCHRVRKRQPVEGIQWGELRTRALRYKFKFPCHGLAGPRYANHLRLLCLGLFLDPQNGKSSALPQLLSELSGDSVHGSALQTVRLLCRIIKWHFPLVRRIFFLHRVFHSGYR